MPSRYTAVPNPRGAPEDELEAAFESDGDDDEHQPHMARTPAAYEPLPEASAVPQTPGGYNFERVHDYDYPPPGSPPRPSSVALPNDFGNSNGRLPSGPIMRPVQAPSFLQRLWPARYTRVPTSAEERVRRLGGGLENDGVFGNVMAKPVVSAARVERGDDGIYVVPEEVQKEAPPSYAVAQADAVPPYWETTVHAPTAGAAGEMIVDGLATGSFFSFMWNMLISLSFNFVGFLLTYLLHTTHAAKYGSRAGLGVTLLQYGFAMRNQRSSSGGSSQGEDDWPWASQDPAPTTSEPDMVNVAMAGGNMTVSPATALDSGTTIGLTQEWIAFFFMTFGWFLLLTSFLGYWRVKRWERQIMRTATPPTNPAEAIERERAVRQTLENVFGITGVEAQPQGEWDLEQGRRRAAEEVPMTREELRLRDDLRSAGLI